MIRSSKAALIQPTAPIPHEDWNTAVEEYRRNRPLICGSRAEGGWRHPWKPLIEWDDNRAAWTVNIKPGFVNAGEVEVTMDLDASPEATQIRAKNDPGILVGPSRVRARLSEEPNIPISAWRKIGADADATGLTLNATGTGGTVNYESVHPFFLSMGVGAPPLVTYSTTSGRRDVLNGEDRSEDRLLRAVEVVLEKQRQSVTAEWTVGEVRGGGSIAQFDVVYAGGVEIREEPFITIRTSYSPPVPQDPIERLRGNWQDDGRDELHIATLYLVSLPGADHGSEPDASWEAFHQSHVFWNLNHATNILPVTQEPEPLRFPIPLANDIARGIIDSIVDSLNDRYDAAVEFVTNRSLEGRFWTT